MVSILISWLDLVEDVLMDPVSASSKIQGRQNAGLDQLEIESHY